MKKKNSSMGSEEENEFEVDEPEEIQNDASEDDWTPEVDNSRGRRSSRLRNIPKSRAPIIDPSSSDEDGSDQSLGHKRKGGKGRGRGRPAAKKSKVSSSSPAVTPSKNNKAEEKEDEDDDEVDDEEEEDDDDLDNSNENSDSEPSSTTNSGNFTKISKDFTSGAFVILKTDAANEDVDPPLWKIDGKALLQKYIPFEQDGKTMYKNTSVYSGWTITNKNNYYPVAVTFKQQTRKEHIVEFTRDQIKKKNKRDSSQEVTLNENKSEISQDVTSSKTAEIKGVTTQKTLPEAVDPPVENPVIKVKSFAVVPNGDSTAAKQLEETNIQSNPSSNSSVHQINEHVTGTFLVLKTDAPKKDFPIWKIDGKSLLQKYKNFNEGGEEFYRSTAEYAGWSLDNRHDYYPLSVTFKRQDKKEHVVKLDEIRGFSK